MPGPDRETWAAAAAFALDLSSAAAFALEELDVSSEGAW
jgi:hypothetical protein